MVSWHSPCGNHQRNRHGKLESSEAANSMEIYVALQPLAALIAGVLIVMMPRLLNYIVALYLIAIGILGLLRM